MIVPRRRPAGQRLTALLAAGVAVALLTGCGLFGGDDHPSSTRSASTSTPAPSPSDSTTPQTGHVDYGSATAVCNAFTDTLFSGDPAVESQTDPIDRAGKYVTATYRETFLQTTPRLAHWQDWSDAGATEIIHTPIRYVGEKSGKDKRNRRYRVAARRIYPADSQGNPLGQTYGFVVYCTLIRDGTRWLVADSNQGSIDPNP